MNPAYLVPRLLRHFLPEWATRFLLLRSLVIKPGLETVDPEAAVERYAQVLRSSHGSLRGKRILVFGYGGRFDIGVHLLRAGAAYVALCDAYARTDDRHNMTLLGIHGDSLMLEAGRPRPRPERMGLIEADVRSMALPPRPLRYDLVVSNSVFEHLEDAGEVTRTLAGWSTPDCTHIHFVDLRDHYFKYPFEMLRYSERAWRRWLNPGSNHNRLRLWDYRRIFEACFREAEISVLDRDAAAFQRILPHIRSEFASGNPAEDSATLVLITARGPRL